MNTSRIMDVCVEFHAFGTYIGLLVVITCLSLCDTSKQAVLSKRSDSGISNTTMFYRGTLCLCFSHNAGCLSHNSDSVCPITMKLHTNMRPYIRIMQIYHFFRFSNPKWPPIQDGRWPLPPFKHVFLVSNTQKYIF